MTKKIICFDMDGTIADFYGVENWLEKLRRFDATPYIDAKPLWDMEALKQVLVSLISSGWEIQVISWLSKESNKQFDKEVREAKRSWLAENGFPATKVHLVKYGTTKADCIRKEKPYAILVDDNKKVRDGWHLGATIDPTSVNILTELKKLC